MYLKFYSNLPGANELISGQQQLYEACFVSNTSIKSTGALRCYFTISPGDIFQ